VTAVLLLPAQEGRSPKWYELRRDGITASEIPAVIGISPDTWASPFNLYHRKKNGLGDDGDSLQMRIGHQLEDLIVEEFFARHQEFARLESGLYRHAEREWQLATPDGLAADDASVIQIEEVEQDGEIILDVHYSDPIAVVEAKTAGSYDGWGDEGTDEIPAHYRAQVLWQMDVLGVGVGYVPVLFLPVRKIREYVVEYHAEDCALMRKHAEDFMRRLAEDDEPPVDWTPATTRTLKVLHPDLTDETAQVSRRLATRFRSAHRRLEVADKAYRQAQNQLRHAMGSANRAAVDDEPLATRSKYERREYVVKATTVDSIRIAKQKEPS